jgi:hypothetical protein
MENSTLQELRGKIKIIINSSLNYAESRKILIGSLKRWVHSFVYLNSPNSLKLLILAKFNVFRPNWFYLNLFHSNIRNKILALESYTGTSTHPNKSSARASSKQRFFQRSTESSTSG